eukprot:169849_1
MDSDQIVSSLLSMNIGNKAHIIEAMESVYDATNIDEIITYIFDQQCFDNEDNGKKDSDNEWGNEPNINPSNLCLSSVRIACFSRNCQLHSSSLNLSHIADIKLKL